MDVRIPNIRTDSKDSQPINPLLHGVPLQVTPSRGIHFTDEDTTGPISRRNTDEKRGRDLNGTPPLNSTTPLERSSSTATAVRRRSKTNPTHIPHTLEVHYQSLKPLALAIEPGPFQLPRMHSVAVFQRQHSGIGAPHSFVSFLKHCPALPRVVVSSYLSYYDNLLIGLVRFS